MGTFDWTRIKDDERAIDRMVACLMKNYSVECNGIPLAGFSDAKTLVIEMAHAAVQP